MTFTLPEDLASIFTRHVSARDRSRYVADAIAAKLAEKERRLIRACQMANQDKSLRQVEHELDALTDGLPDSYASKKHAAKR